MFCPVLTPISEMKVVKLSAILAVLLTCSPSILKECGKFDLSFCLPMALFKMDHVFFMSYLFSSMRLEKYELFRDLFSLLCDLLWV